MGKIGRKVGIGITLEGKEEIEGGRDWVEMGRKRGGIETEWRERKMELR